MVAVGDESKATRLLAWMQLARVSAVPSAASNILAGFLVANQTWQPVSDLTLLVFSSCSLYASGMVLNDICDIETDRLHRSNRALVSGRISLLAAWRFYGLLTLIGWATSILVAWGSFAVAIALTAMIIFYNVVLKRTVWAPFAMGLCRALNLWLGASSQLGSLSTESSTWPVRLAVISFGIAVLIIGLTFFARYESRQQGLSRREVMSCWLLACIMALGYGSVAACDLPMPLFDGKRLGINFVFLAIIFVIGAVPLFRVIAAAIQRRPELVKTGVIAVIRSLIFVDAAICYLVRPDQIGFAAATLLLLIPAVLLSRSVSAT